VDEVLAKFDEIHPPLSEVELSEIDANIQADSPSDFDECYAGILEELKPEVIDKLLTGTELEKALLRFTLGMSIRNIWLWGGQSGVYKYFMSNGVIHPDDMSEIILDGFFNRLNGEDFDLDERIYEYKKNVVISVLTYVDNGGTRIK